MADQWSPTVVDEGRAEAIALLWAQAEAERQGAARPVQAERDAILSLRDRLSQPGTVAVLVSEGPTAVGCCYAAPHRTTAGAVSATVAHVSGSPSIPIAGVGGSGR